LLGWGWTDLVRIVLTLNSKKKSTGYETPLLSPKLEEILPNMVKGLSPSNLKRTATNLMDEWERSLTDPQYPHQSQNKENNA
jgi:hypothetical protein